ncbi:N-acetyl-D-glucosamine kinase [Diorhabda carinulata]|uniref:N-acetyl-D-glucosamine kinase n=1 Tax=Diorhabda carinulata TaxID=1163345 RepID=UPI0025A115BF|nr:N-acetyl-D-glucosamine kinase [Diorhabda carinulata]
MSIKLIGGVEGGSTHSNAVIMDSSGKIIGQAKGPSTNPYQQGLEECQKRLAQLIKEAKNQAGISPETKLNALGLSLSGCESEELNNKLLEGLQSNYPNLAEKIIVASDTEGSVATTSNKGGIVCIAGTGSNTLLINPDGTKAQCGGWGHLLGDEGSAWYVSHTAIKYCFDDLDNFEKSPYPIDEVWKLVKVHFNITTQPDILDYFYIKFDKALIASLAKNLSELASVKKDPLALHIFSKAGSCIAKSISAVVLKASPELKNKQGGIHVTAVGSLWFSWELLKPGFMKFMSTTTIEELTLIRLTVAHGVGATYLASDKFEVPLQRDYLKNYTILYNYKKNKCPGQCEATVSS